MNYRFLCYMQLILWTCFPLSVFSETPVEIVVHLKEIAVVEKGSCVHSPSLRYVGALSNPSDHVITLPVFGFATSMLRLHLAYPNETEGEIAIIQSNIIVTPSNAYRPELLPKKEQIFSFIYYGTLQMSNSEVNGIKYSLDWLLPNAKVDNVLQAVRLTGEGTLDIRLNENSFKQAVVGEQ